MSEVEVKLDGQDIPPYTFDLFQAQAMRTAKDIDLDDDNAVGMEIIHATLLLTSEAGELADAVKKWFAYGQKLDVVNVLEECSDCLWAIAMLCSRLGVKMEDVAVSNISKLALRYPEKFTQEAAIARADKQ